MTAAAIGKPTPASAETVESYSGEVVYFYAFDVAYEMHRRPIQTLLGQPVVEFAAGHQ